MNALRNVHRALRPGGLLVDLHPRVPFTVEASGISLGSLDDREFAQTVAATEAGLDQTVRDGLFARDGSLRFEVLERFDDSDELVETVSGWDGVRVPARLAARIRAARPPVDVRERLVLERLRAV